jgi:hypothetical protein
MVLALILPEKKLPYRLKRRLSRLQQQPGCTDEEIQILVILLIVQH